MFRCPLSSRFSLNRQRCSNFKILLCGLSSDQQKVVDHFNKFSSDWWDENGGMKLLHAFNRIRVPIFIDCIIKNKGTIDYKSASDILHNTAVLEIGCGAGTFAEAIAKLGCKVHGIDVSSELIDAAKSHAKLNPFLTNLHYSVGTLEDCSKDNFEKYDVVVASEVIEHVSEKEIFIKHCVDCVKPNGSIFLTTPHKSIASLLIGVCILEKLLNVIPRGTHEWKEFIAVEDLKSILETYNSKTESVVDFTITVFKKRCILRNYFPVFYALHATKRQN